MPTPRMGGEGRVGGVQAREASDTGVGKPGVFDEMLERLRAWKKKMLCRGSQIE